jgi:hypothetical protein
MKTLENELANELVAEKVMMSESIKRSQRTDPNWVSVNSEDALYNFTGTVLAFPYLKGTSLVGSPKGFADVLFNSGVSDPPHWRDMQFSTSSSSSSSSSSLEEEREKEEEGDFLRRLEKPNDGTDKRAKKQKKQKAFNAHHLKREKMTRKSAQMAIKMLSDVFMGLVQQSHLGTPDLLTPSVNNEDAGIFWTKMALREAAKKRVAGKTHQSGVKQTERAKTTFHKPFARKILEYKSLCRGDKKALTMWEIAETDILYEKYDGDTAFELENQRAQERLENGNNDADGDDGGGGGGYNNNNNNRGRGGRGGRGRGRGGKRGGGGGWYDDDDTHELNEDYVAVSELAKRISECNDEAGCSTGVDTKKVRFKLNFTLNHYKKTAPFAVDPTEKSKVSSLKKECEEKIKIFVRRLRLKKKSSEKEGRNGSSVIKDKFAHLCKRRCAAKDISAVYAQQSDGDEADVGYMIYAVIMDPNFSPADALECVLNYCAHPDDNRKEDRTFSKEAHRACHIKDDLLYSALGCEEKTAFSPIFCESSALEAGKGKFTAAEWRSASAVYQDLVPNGDVREEANARVDGKKTLADIVEQLRGNADVEDVEMQYADEGRKGRLEGLSKEDVSNDILLGAYESRDPTCVFSIQNAHAWADFFGAEVEGDMSEIIYTEAMEALKKAPSSSSSTANARSDKGKEKDDEDDNDDERRSHHHHHHGDPYLNEWAQNNTLFFPAADSANEEEEENDEDPEREYGDGGEAISRKYSENQKLWIALNQFYSSGAYEKVKNPIERQLLIRKILRNPGFALSDAFLPSPKKIKEILGEKPIFVPPGRKGSSRSDRDTYICPYSSCFYTSQGGRKGWNSFYLPWLGHPMIRFVAEKILGINSPDVLSQDRRKENAEDYFSEEEEGGGERSEKRPQTANEENDDYGDYTGNSGGDGEEAGRSMMAKIARDLIRELNSGGRNNQTLNVNGINTNIMPLMDEHLLESALRHVNKKKNADRFTKITSEEVEEVLKKITTYAPIDQDLTNALVYLKNKTEAVKKLILKDKPSLAEICKSSPTTMSMDEADMGTSMSNLWFDPEGKPNPFTKAFYRFCELKSNLAHRIMGEFENIICCESILTKGTKAVNDYRKKELEKFDMRAARHDLTMSTFDNVLERMALMVKVDQHVAHATQYWFLVFFSILDASRYAFALHLNLLNTGQFASSKSYTCNAAIRCCIPGTVVLMDDFTPRAFAVGQDCSDRMYYSDEMSPDLANSGSDESNAKAVLIKKMLTEGFMLLLLFTWVEMPGNMMKERAQLSIRCNCSSSWVCNANKTNLPESLLSRFCRIMWAKDLNALKDMVDQAKGKIDEKKKDAHDPATSAAATIVKSRSFYAMVGITCGGAMAETATKEYEAVDGVLSCGKSLNKLLVKGASHSKSPIAKAKSTSTTATTTESSNERKKSPSPSPSKIAYAPDSRGMHKTTQMVCGAKGEYQKKLEKQFRLTKAAASSCSSSFSSSSSSSSSSASSMSRESTPDGRASSSDRYPDHSDLRFPGNASQQTATTATATSTTTYRRSSVGKTLVKTNAKRTKGGGGGGGPKSKEADAVEARGLESANVMQNMFFEDMGGAENNPYATNTEEDDLSKKVKTIQALEAMAFKEIYLGILPEVNMSVAHLVALKFFYLLKKKTGYSLNNYRTYERIIIVARLRTLWSAIEEVFTSESSELGATVANDGFKVSMLLRLAPYLVCQWNDIIFAITSLTAEFINPFQPVIITIMGNKVCGYTAKRNQIKTIENGVKEYGETARDEWARKKKMRISMADDVAEAKGKQQRQQKEAQLKKMTLEMTEKRTYAEYVLEWKKTGNVNNNLIEAKSASLALELKERKEQLIRLLGLYDWVVSVQCKTCSLAEFCFSLRWLRRKQEKSLETVNKNCKEARMGADGRYSFRTDSEEKNSKESKKARKRFYRWKTTKARKVMAKIDHYLPKLTKHQNGELEKKIAEKRTGATTILSKKENEFILDRFMNWIYEPNALIATTIRSQAGEVVAAANVRKDPFAILRPPVAPTTTAIAADRGIVSDRGALADRGAVADRGRERDLNPDRLPAGRHSSSSESASEAGPGGGEEECQYGSEDEAEVISSLNKLAIGGEKGETAARTADDEDMTESTAKKQKATVSKAKPKESVCRLLCGYFAGNLMPHEVFLAFNGKKDGGISWCRTKAGHDFGSYKGISEAEDDQNGKGSTSMNSFQQKEQQQQQQQAITVQSLLAMSHQQQQQQYQSTDTRDAYDLNYLECLGRLPDLVTKISRNMKRAGPSVSDITQIMEKLGDQSLEVENAYSRALTIEEIGKVGSMSVAEAIKQGYMVEKKMMPIMIVDAQYKSGDKANVGTIGRILISTHSVNASVGTKKLITEILEEMVYKGMTPGRTTLGMMENADRGKFDWFDITDEMLESCPREEFSVETGGSLTDREHNILSYVYDFSSHERSLEKLEKGKKRDRLRNSKRYQVEEGDWRKKVNKQFENTVLGGLSASLYDAMELTGETCAKELVELETRLFESLSLKDEEDDESPETARVEPLEVEDSQSEASTQEDHVPNKRKERKKVDAARNNSLKRSKFVIKEDLNLWGVKRHFINAGILVTTDPVDGSLKWLFVDEEESKKIAKMSEEERKKYVPMVEYRHFPTTFNQRMRSIASFAVNHPKELERQSHLFYIDPVEVGRAARFYFERAYDEAARGNICQNDAAAATMTTTTTISNAVDEESESTEDYVREANKRKRLREEGEEHRKEVRSVSPSLKKQKTIPTEKQDVSPSRKEVRAFGTRKGPVEKGELHKLVMKTASMARGQHKTVIQ